MDDEGRFVDDDEADRLVEGLTVAVQRLATAALTGEQIDRIHAPVRTQAGRLYGLCGEWETTRMDWWYDLHATITAAARAEHQSVGDVWVRLLDAGALAVRPRVFLKTVRDLGVEPAEKGKP